MYNVFQIWIGGDMPLILNKMVEENRKCFNHILFGEKEINEILLNAPKNIVEKYNSMEVLSGKSSFIRLYILSLHPDWIYLDADCVLNPNFIAKEGILFGNLEKKKDDYLIVGNNDIKTIKILLKRMLKSKITKRGLGYWNMQDLGTILSPKYYIHIRTEGYAEYMEEL